MIILIIAVVASDMVRRIIDHIRLVSNPEMWNQQIES